MARDRYLAANPSAAYYIEFGDFVFYRLNVESIRYVGGYGRMSWVDADSYATAKAGLVGLTRELARGLAPEVRVNGIAPGYVNSNWDCSFGDIEAAAKLGTALQRVGQPEDYAEVIVWLCAGAGYITGQVIPVTGGLAL